MPVTYKPSSPGQVIIVSCAALPHQEPAAHHPALRQRGRQHQGESQEGGPASLQGLLAQVHPLPQGSCWKGL